MKLHNFEPKIAMQVGLNAAVLFQNIKFWVKKNQADGRNQHEGRYWTYNSIAEFALLLPYLTEKQIRTAVDKLSKAGLILKGQFSNKKYDRTTWYTLADTICLEGRVDLTEAASDGVSPVGKPNAAEGKSIKNRYKPDIKPYPPRRAGEVIEILERIWLAYPSDRRRNEATCRAYIKDATTGGVPAEDLLQAVKNYAVASAGFTRSKVYFSDNWFKSKRWRDCIDEMRTKRQEAGIAMADPLERVAGWINDLSPMCKIITPPQIIAMLDAGLVNEAQIQAAGLGRCTQPTHFKSNPQGGGCSENW